MKTIAIVGPRQMTDKERSLSLIDAIVSDFRRRVGDDINIVTMGCDQAFGMAVKEYINANTPPLRGVEMCCFFIGKRNNNEEYVQSFCSRNAAIVDHADEVHIIRFERRRSIVDDILKRTKEGTIKNYYVYTDKGELIEQRVDCLENAAGYAQKVM